MENKGNLILREDTFLGICEGLGEDLRVNSNLIRLALAGMLFWNPVAAFGTYGALGLLVLLTRLVFPNPRLPAPTETGVEPEPVQVEERAEEQPVPLAA